MKKVITSTFYASVKEIIEKARRNAYRTINFVMVGAYWHIGRLIVEEEQKGSDRAEYGAYIIRDLSAKLTADLGKGFSEQSLRNFRQFYLRFPFRSTLWRELNNNKPENIQGTEKHSTVWSENVFQDFLRAELSWSHYKLLIRIENETARNWYMKEAAEQGWSVRALQRQIDSLYYERLLSSKNKKVVLNEAADKTDNLKTRPEDILKDPYILEFLNLREKSSFRESEFEQCLIDKLQEFLLELGKGFAFVARQQRISTETKEFYIDLVFYNYYLKCFVIIDLKTGDLTHQDVGQMDMYVRIFDDLKRQKNDNPTVGIILCTEKDETIVKYSVLKENRQLFASKYMLYLPNEEELKAELERERRLIEMELAKRREDGG